MIQGRSGALRKRYAMHQVPREVGRRYRIERLLAEGGMGSVHAALDMALDREVAVKLLFAQGEAEDVATALERFRREARIAASLQHPGIAVTHDFGLLPPNGAYIVMELLAGPTLRNYLAACGPAGVPRGDVASIGRQVADALMAAHALGVLHRDLTPSNLMLAGRADDGPRCKIVDFGISSLREDIPPAPPRTLMGTRSYIAPEMFRGAHADERVDLYALGVILHEMLMGCVPARAADGTLDPTAIRALEPSGALGDLIVRALAVDPARRWPSAGAMLVALNELGSSAGKTRPARPVVEAVVHYAQRDQWQSTEPLSLPSRDIAPESQQRDAVTADMAELEPIAAQTTEREAPARAPLHRRRRFEGDMVTRWRTASLRQRPGRRSAVAVTAAVLLALFTVPSSITDTEARRYSALVTETPGIADAASHDVPGPVEEPAITPAPALPAEEAHSVLATKLQDWIAATNARDLERQRDFYPAMLEAFYLWREVPLHAVMAEKRRVFSAASIVDITVGAPQIHFEAEGSRAVMHFRKQYVIQGPAVNRRGEVLQQLRWLRTEAGWRIVSERDLQVIS